jgi:hypothetical protein
MRERERERERDEQTEEVTYSAYPSGNSQLPTRPGPPILGCWDE